MNWKPIREKPTTAEPLAALIATIDEDDERYTYLMGIYIWRNGKWVDEEHLKPLRPGRYWWVPEAEVLRTLPTLT